MINTNEAPEGYVAVPNPVNSYGCEFCAFSKLNTIYCKIELAVNGVLGMCSGQYREDSTDVYFIKKDLNDNSINPIT